MEEVLREEVKTHGQSDHGRGQTRLGWVCCPRYLPGAGHPAPLRFTSGKRHHAANLAGSSLGSITAPTANEAALAAANWVS